MGLPSSNVKGVSTASASITSKWRQDDSITVGSFQATWLSSTRMIRPFTSTASHTKRQLFLVCPFMRRKIMVEDRIKSFQKMGAIVDRRGEYVTFLSFPMDKKPAFINAYTFIVNHKSGTIEQL
jgi:hypothetical protein